MELEPTSRWAIGAALTVAIALVFNSPVTAQDQPKHNAPKIDSIVVTISKPRDKAMDEVVAAFMANRLQVTNTTSSMVEANLGRKIGLLAQFERIVRAILVERDNQTTVLLVGDELRYSGTIYDPPLRYRIDNKAKSEGGSVWQRIVAVARQLDPELDTTDLNVRLPAGSGGRSASAAVASRGGVTGDSSMYHSEPATPPRRSDAPAPTVTPVTAPQPAQPAQRVTADTSAPSSTLRLRTTAPSGAPSAGPARFRAELLQDGEFRVAFDDAQRLGVARDFQEMQFGLLRVMVGPGFATVSSARYNLEHLYGAYRTASNRRADPVIELWKDGAKIGEVTAEGVLVGAEFSAPR